jgi:hypothetical protein
MDASAVKELKSFLSIHCGKIYLHQANKEEITFSALTAETASVPLQG